MPTLYSLTSTTALANLRTDLSDTGSVRWTDVALNRAIDRALERISEVYPLVKETLTLTTKHVKRYAFPAGAASIDRIEYPLELWPRKLVNYEEYRTPFVPNPTVAPSPAQGAGAGSLGTGTYLYAYTWVVPGGGETLPSPTGSVNLLVANLAVGVSAIPTPPEGVVAVNIYRTAAGGAQLKYAGQEAGPPADISSLYTDTLADASLGVNAPTTNTTEGLDAYYLLLPPELTPPDSSSWMNVGALYKHQLDTTGTTLPERFWDCLYLGAAAYAVDAYIQVTNDNFEFADGMLRDKIDDTKSMASWTQQAHTLTQRFTERLHELRAEWIAHRSGTVQWGDIQLRQERI